MKAPTPAQDLAKVSLIATARAVSAALVDYEKWLVAGTGAAVGLAFGSASPAFRNLSHAQQFWTVGLVGASLFLACLVLLLGAQVAASLQTSDDVAAAVLLVLEKHGPISDPAPLMEGMRAEVEAALWWPASWGFRYGFNAAARGDFVAGVRLATKLAQVQQYFFVLQLLALLTAGAVTSAANVG